MSKKNSFLTVFFVVITFVSLFGQKKIYGKVVPGNGKVNHGYVVRYEPQKFVEMMVEDKLMTFDLSGGDKKFFFTSTKPPKRYIFPDGKYYFRESVGVLPDESKVTNSGFSYYLDFSVHYQRTRMFGYGVKLSFDNFNSKKKFAFLTPAIVYYGYLKEKNVSPYIHAFLGYGIPIKDKEYQKVAIGGLNAGLGFGFRMSTNKVMVDLILGLKSQKAYYELEYPDRYVKTEAFFNRFFLGMGFMF